jgi:intein-encoded DNA endonuclease-like protein
VRYQKGESLKRIAGSEVDPVTVFNHLHNRGLQLRDKVEAQIEAVSKHKHTPFTGDMRAAAYLVGFTTGDLYVQEHGRAVRVRTATSHPGMTKLFRTLFSGNGPVYEYPRENRLTGYEWSLDCDLDKSFAFLLDREAQVESAFNDETLFLYFLAGFFDAEGSLYFHKKKEYGAFEMSLANMNEVLLRRIAEKLSMLGYKAKVSRTRQDIDKAISRGITNSSGWIWRIVVWRYKDVKKLLRALPIRHPEKVAKREVALKLEYRSGIEDRRTIVLEWQSLKGKIKREVLDYVALAREKIAVRNELRTPIGGEMIGC